MVAKTQTAAPWGRRIGLGLGDVAVFLGFAAAGRSAHQGGLDIVELAEIAAPLALGWLAVAPLAGLYRPDVAEVPSAALKRTALAWAAAGPLGLLLRGTVFGKAVPMPFAITTLLIALAMLLGWRGGYAAWRRR